MIGETGSGKSSLLKVISGLWEAKEGLWSRLRLCLMLISFVFNMAVTVGSDYTRLTFAVSLYHV